MVDLYAGNVLLYFLSLRIVFTKGELTVPQENQLLEQTRSTEEMAEEYQKHLHNPEVDENGIDELGINVAEFMLVVLRSDPDKSFSEEELQAAYIRHRHEKSVEIALSNLVEAGVAHIKIDEETGEELVSIDADAKERMDEYRKQTPE